jgi:hypothetical protein
VLIICSCDSGNSGFKFPSETFGWGNEKSPSLIKENSEFIVRLWVGIIHQLIKKILVLLLPVLLSL